MTVAPVPQYRALRGLLLALAILAAIAGIAILFDPQLIFLALPMPREQSAHTIITVLIQDLGALVLGFGILLYRASREPVRYLSVVDAFIVILVLFSGVDVYAVEELHFGDVYPATMVWVRIAVRLVLAIVLLSLRPRAVRD